jgi:energy-coupling factor transporter ATP-binding protein EcfA2
MKTEEIQTAIYNAFEPNVPADSRFYADCKEARGGSALVKKMIDRLNSAKNENLRYLFTGHLGCGKSSELLHLADKLEKETTFFPVYIDFEEYLDKQDATLEDIFLGMISEIASRCRDKFEIKVKEESYSLIKKIAGFFGDFSAKGEIGLPFDIAKLNIEKLRQNPNLRQQVRAAIKQDEKKSLFSELNDFIMEIELRLKQETEFNKLIIIADSLEKIKRFEKGEKEEDEIISQEKLFLGKSEQLTGIATNVIYTVPLSLYRSHYGTQLPQFYGKNVFVLPMVKIHQRGKFDEPFEIGRQELIEIINKRLKHTGTSIDKVFKEDALEYLLKYCGGHIRSLVRFVQEASIAVDELPIDFKAARESVKEEVRSFAASVRESYWDKLAKLESSTNQQIENGDDDYSKMLESLAILEYMNGDEVETDDDVWYAVNPSIRLTIKFKEALAKLNPPAEN